MMDFLSLSNFSSAEIQALLKLAQELEKNPVNDALYRKVIGLVFMNPSLRTLASFQAGIGQMGGTAVVIQPGAGSWQLEHRDGIRMDGDAQEHIREAIPVLASYCDILGIRSFAGQKDLEVDLADGLMAQFADLSPKPLINMESASDHPCQALADWKTLDDLYIPDDGNFVLSWAWHPKPLPYAVPNAALMMAAQRGMNITVLRPEGYDLPQAMIDRANALGAKDIVQTSNRSEGLEDAHVLYCKSWCAPQHYGRHEEELEFRHALTTWCVADDWFKSARPDAKFMHCLPVRRNVKVCDEVLDGPRSVVTRQAENRLHVQKSVLMTLMENN